MLTIFVVEIFQPTDGATIGFFPIKTTTHDMCAELAGQLCSAFEFGMQTGVLDWRCVSEIPSEPGSRALKVMRAS
ncbi:hypothetical protein ABZ543_13265 [Streptomyces roseifaciens]